MTRTAISSLLLGLCCHAGIALAAAGPQEIVDTGVVTDVLFAAWAAGDGDQSSARLHCVASADTNKANPPPKDTSSRLPYNLRIIDLGAPSGYYLYLNGDDTATGNERVAVQFQHRDIKEGTGYQTLSDNVYDTHSHLGQFRNCGNGDNSEISVLVGSIGLASARAGSYIGRFRAEVRGGLSGTTTASTDFQVSIDVSNQVRISALDNIDLGDWMGIGALTAAETFCVYSNNAAATYNITITSPNQDAGRNFFVVNAGASAAIPYSLWFIDNTSGGLGTSVGAVAISGTGDNAAMDCNGADNATLSLTIDEAALATAISDAYGDTLTLLVAPE